MESSRPDASPPRDEPNGLNASQRLFVLTRFAKIDELLQAIAGAAAPDLSPFSRYVPDVPAHEAGQLKAIASGVRKIMSSALRDLLIELPAPDRSTQWMVKTSLISIDVALAGMTKKDLGGYGEVDARALERLQSAVREISEMIDEARRIAANAPSSPG